MTQHADRFDTVPRLPSWITSRTGTASEDAAVLAGAALGHVQLALRDSRVPHDLLRQRLALRVAEGCVRATGRPERASDLRDAVAFLQTGDAAGPAGDIYIAWHRAAARPVTVSALHRTLSHLAAEDIADWMDAGKGSPIARAEAVISAVRAARPRDRVAALILGNAALNQALGWPGLMPLLGVNSARFDKAEDLRAACYAEVIAASASILRDAEDLSRRAERLRAVAPKLRAKGADAAVALLLSRDALPATAFISLRSDRAARRFCDRLVALGAVRELTGRDTFRLYGL